ncbi:RlmE family RNA methyltransferase [Wolbachia endosymbiont of Howardula sp.]|uniref:RlmE family RNA methyltransferase n=1 Tax=Wolbachia endosymbiont of Howardula sp. TaxID=2916816 RepID=UPI00217EEA49|nr:RlmE family RNA methyltransferase [Wolbachia endosymbiont of Howardula sp.]UWI83393.1 RlmE family RNA methyltransferase [Wolbachia endosymbiont of Howardula sp.]
MRWLSRHLSDHYVQKTSINGYRSRSAYKLIEIHNRFNLLYPGQRVLDLGASPGGWSQVATKQGAHVIAIDIQDMKPITGVQCIKCDIVNNSHTIISSLKAKKFDLILSDMASQACGIHSLHHIRIMMLCEAALSYTKVLLKSGGVFVVKILQGEYDQHFFFELKKHFDKVRYFKPQASRSESTEIYLISTGFYSITQ